MAKEISAFFNSSNFDRSYMADRFAQYFRDVVTDGVLSGGNNLRVTANGTAMAVELSFGRANIQGYAYWLEDDNNGKLVLPLDPGESLARIDRAILRLDKNNERSITGAILKGTPAASPAAPALVRTDTIYEISLARIRVNANKMTVAQSDITDERLTASVCGLMNSLITVDTSDMMAIFNAFMATIQAQSPMLISDIVDNLTSTSATKPLAARQGKALNDKITGLISGDTPVYAVYG